MHNSLRRAEILHEALPYIQRFAGKTVVIKYGGHAMVDPELKAAFARDIVLLKQVGIDPVVVHGGGPQIASHLEKLDIKSEFVQGLRVTDQTTMDVVEMVLVGQVNKDIVNRMTSVGGKAVGLSGKDGGLIEATKKVLTSTSESNPLDIGNVGEVQQIHPQIIETLDDAGFIPVIAPVGRTTDGQTLNINADDVASAIACALQAEKLILLTDVPGLKVGERWLKSADASQIPNWIDHGEATDGMIPKLQCVQRAIDSNVGAVHILDGRAQHAVLLELLTDDGIGTMFASGAIETYRD